MWDVLPVPVLWLSFFVDRQWIRIPENKESRTNLPISMRTVFVTFSGVECYDGDNTPAITGAGTINNVVHVVLSQAKATYALIIGAN